ncbi:TPA: VaFE repeat-containing surface-anchored protein [Clostridioides difficile]|nr:VaFE repeat-containing surface-anchored protein [Clostridioides difficile]
MKKILKRLCTGVLTLATVFTALPISQVHASDTQYWTDAQEKAGYVEKVMNDGSIGSTFHEGIMTVEGETAYCIDINTDFTSGYKTRSDASTRMSADQIADVALSLEYVKQYGASHKELNHKQVYLLEQCVVWQRLSVHLGWQCDNVRASYDEISKAVQDEVYAGAKAFVKANKGRYECGGYIYTGNGQDLGQFWAELDVGNAKLQKVSSNTSVTNGNDVYSLAGAVYGVFSDKDCKNAVATLTTDENGNTEAVEVKAGTVYIREQTSPAGFQIDTTIHPLTVEAGKTATLKVSDTPKVTTTLIDLFKIDMETGKTTAQGNASLEGAEFVWNYYDGFYKKDNLPAGPTRTWTTKTIAERDSDGIHYVTRLADKYKVSGDSFYTQDGTTCLPIGTITVSESKAPAGYLLEGAYLQAGGSSEQIKGVYVAQITEDGDLAVLSGSNQYSVSDKVIRGGVKIQKRDLETKDTKPQGGATLKDTEFTITSLNENPVLVDGKLYNKNEVVKTIHTGVDGIASTDSDTLPYGKFRISESKPATGYLTVGAVPREFEIVENGKIVDLTDKEHSIYNQIKRGDIEGVKIGAGTHKRLADVPFKITSKTTGESHIVVTDKNGQFSTASDWASHKANTNAGKTSEDGVWFGTSEPDDSKGALIYDTYEIEELRCKSNTGFKLIPAFEIVVSKDKAVIDLGTLTDEYEKEITIHTTATDKATGGKSIIAGKTVTIVDTVTLDGLEKGTKYQLKGWQMVKGENAELIIDGKRVESDYTFTADSDSMKVEIAYTFNASQLGGKDLVTFEELYDLSNPDEPVKVAEHKDMDDKGQTVSIEKRVIAIHTTATDKVTGEKSIIAGKTVTIIDTVTLDGLEKGTKYQLKGWQMVKDENAELVIDGQRVENDYTFTADSDSMKVEIAFSFNASQLGGKNLVTFEELYDLSNPDEPVKVAEHKDIEDNGQTVLITERIISIHTTATDKETGKKEIEAGKDVTIIDTVTLDGLEVGTKYQLKGWQMVKGDNAELTIDGKRVENEYTFTAESEKMEIQISFTFDASQLGGKQLVTFEELYDLSNPDEPVKIAEHKDIEDGGQTVTIMEKPETPETPTPEEPKQPSTPETPVKKTNSPKTGDTTNVIALFALLGASGIGLAGTYFLKKRNAKKS